MEPEIKVTNEAAGYDTALYLGPVQGLSMTI